MPSIKEVKNRIGSIKSTQQLTKAMKMVAAAKLKKAQDKVLQLRPYSNKLNEVLSKEDQPLPVGASPRRKGNRRPQQFEDRSNESK